MTRPRLRPHLLSLLALTLAPACGAQTTASVPVYGYRIVKSYPHDPKAFTQGLLYDAGYLFEGTGQYGQSQLRRVELRSGKVLQKRDLPADVFGEGLAKVSNRLIQLSWTNRRGFVWDAKTFAPLHEFTHDTEGWGLTSDGRRLILSDGSDTLYFLDPQTYKVTGRVRVRDGGKPVDQLNELEYIDGEVWANVWQTDRIARIDPASGRVTAWVDLSGLRQTALAGVLSSMSFDEFNNAVLNGIAYDPQGKRLFVTGKLWPRLYHIELVKK
ncbi:glutamine cyclotransferase [Deinobacterium chartae]|uniref:Glutamine cyclotransferase n=1 Tax=Deinobacterium chartae TaxID=521158 RepID=A0A841I2N2_9DEIO|nr:glutaminyl-peptide cyclotransferase [Deinobacterium chartae]MBB6099264.1 glutamine cyclotransferase [Deinobacterium chartae]